MILISAIIEDALKDTGLYKAEGKNIGGAKYQEALRKLRIIVDELNLQSTVAFGSQEDIIQLTNNKVIFKPLTEQENEIINAGGTVDLTDRLTDFKPKIAPVVYYKGNALRLVTYKDLVNLRSVPETIAYTFNITPTESQVILNKGNVELTIVRAIPITVDAESYGYVHVDESFQSFLSNKLAEELAITYKLIDELETHKSRARESKQSITVTTSSFKPQYHDFWAGINKFGS